MSEDFDTLIRNARVLDGMGTPAQLLDVGVRGDRIAAVGTLAQASAGRVVDGGGLILSPGFIDAHSHSDTYLLIEPDAPSKITQGVTTEIVGQCGASAAPIHGCARLPSDWAAMVYPTPKRSAVRGQGSDVTDHRDGSESRQAPIPGPTWRSVADYRALFEQVRPAVNTVLMIGHNVLRAGVMDYEARTATADEIAAMCRNLERALDEGGSGLSTGLIYQPGRWSAPEEVLALARVAARRGIYCTHMRSEGARLLEAIDEVLEIGRTTGMRLQISHLKTAGEANWGKLDAAIGVIEAARGSGIRAHADRYPYIAGGTDLDIVLPDWAAAGGRDAILARLADPDERRKISADLDSSRPPEAWEGAMVGGTVEPDLLPLRGRTIAAIAMDSGRTAGEVIVDILRRDELRTGAFFFGMSEANLRRIYAQSWVMVGSDASIRSPEGPLGADHPHPRAYGTFPRFLRLVQDEALMSLEEAVRRITSLPADAFGLQGRGRVVSGACADLVLFDAAAIRDRATFVEPHVFSSGVRQVWVNGRCCYANGRFTGERGGRILQSAFR